MCHTAWEFRRPWGKEVLCKNEVWCHVYWFLELGMMVVVFVCLLPVSDAGTPTFWSFGFRLTSGPLACCE